jgi:hypothetical protein
MKAATITTITNLDSGTVTSDDIIDAIMDIDRNADTDGLSRSELCELLTYIIEGE